MTMLSGSVRWPTIHKDVDEFAVRPNLLDYEATCKSFTWESERDALSGLPGGGLNIAYEAVDRHATGTRAGKDALRFVHADGTVDSMTYAVLAEQTDRFASVLRGLGIGRGERVFSLLGRRAELYVAALGTLKNASAFCPLFSAFGPEPVRQRMQLGSARVLVTTRAFYVKKVVAIRDELPTLEHVLLVDADDAALPDGTHDLRALMQDAPAGRPDRADRGGRHGAPSFHERHDGVAQGRHPRPRRRRRTCGDRAVRTRPPP